MPTGRPRFLTPTRSALLLVLSLSACAGATGPARRHLAAVEAAERALTLPGPDRQRALVSARDELRGVLDASPGLAGARLSLATIHARLDEPELALALAPPPDDRRPEERPAWAALETWAMARAGRWAELIARQPDGELALLAARYRDFAVVVTSCEPASAAPPAAAPLATAGTCCADSAAACRDCLSTAREAWCRGAPVDALLGATTQTAPSPHLELARARLRAAALASAGRHDEARLTLEAAREAAQRLAANPSSDARTRQPEPATSQPPSTALAVLSLDLDRAILFAWSGELEQCRAILTTLMAAQPPEPLLSRIRGLADALSPPAIP